MVLHKKLFCINYLIMNKIEKSLNEKTQQLTTRK